MSQDIRQWSARAIVFVLLCIHQPGCHAAGSGVLPATVLSSSPTQAGDAAGQCGSVSSLAYNDRVMVCIGFEAEDRNEPGGPGSKAVFYPRVDQYSSISVDQLEGVVASYNWTLMQEFSYMWVGVNGQRTVGQEKGFIDADGECVRLNGTYFEPDGDRRVCYGWALHNKPVANPDNYLSTGLTAIVHLADGEVTRVVWDVGCTLCPEHQQELSCLADNTSIVCSSDGGGCSDCYLPIGERCGSGQHACAPKLYVAWVGTDSNGVPMTSAGQIISQYSQYSLQPVYNDLYKQVEDVTAQINV
mmetsp:Transcript_10907/g.21213  ORF Transcript_10907/g.21213 Transcript_10907/m.21213 type:complete len:301 (+) Transcript_10907:235-1137(+)